MAKVFLIRLGSELCVKKQAGVRALNISFALCDVTAMRLKLSSFESIIWTFKSNISSVSINIKNSYL